MFKIKLLILIALTGVMQAEDNKSQPDLSKALAKVIESAEEAFNQKRETVRDWIATHDRELRGAAVGATCTSMIVGVAILAHRPVVAKQMYQSNGFKLAMLENRINEFNSRLTRFEQQQPVK